MTAGRHLSVGKWWVLVGLGICGAFGLRLWGDRTWLLFLNTAKLCAATAAISVPLGALLAWTLLRSDLPLRRGLGLTLGWLLFVPLYLQAAAWQAGFGLQGWFTLALGNVAWLDGWRGAVWIHGMAGVPWVALLVGAGLRQVEPELEDNALLDAWAGQVVYRVTARRMAGSIAASLLWIVILTSSEMVVTDLFRIRTFAEVLYWDMAVGGEPGGAALRAAPSVLFVGWLALAGVLLFARLAPPTKSGGMESRSRMKLGRWRWPWWGLVTVIVVLLVGVPLGSLIYKAGLSVEQTLDGRLRVWSAEKCWRLLAASPSRAWRPLGWSMVISVVASTAALAAAVPAAWLARGKGPWQAVVLTLVGATLALPGPAIGIATVWLFNRRDPAPVAWIGKHLWGANFQLFAYLYDRTVVAPCAALGLRVLPFVALILWYAFQTLPTEPLDSAATEGAGRFGRMWRIALPQRKEALLAAWLVAVALCWGDLSTTLLVLPPGVTTMASHIFNLLHYGVEDVVAADCLATLCWITLLAVGVRISLHRLFRR